MNLSAFWAYDIRGEYPGEINEELAYNVGRALVRYLSAKTIVVGWDMRTSSVGLSKKLIEGLTCEGADVVSIGLCTTPMLNFAVAHYGYDGGIMISASHNPGKDNAFKVIGKNANQLDQTEGLPEIKNLIERGFSGCPGKGAVTEKDVLSDYLAHVLKITEDMCHLNVVVDYGNGVGAITGKPALARMDLEVTELYPEPDGRFPNHPANPHDTVNFNDLIEKVKEKKADLGVFFDGDADRANFVDDLGRIVPVDLLAVLLAKKELGKKKGRVYYDLRFSKSVPDLLKEAGGEPVMMRVGNPFYKRALREKGGILGAEFSGHIMFPENYNLDDGLFAVLKTIKLLCDSGKKLSDLLDEVRIYEASPEESTEAKNPATLFDRLYAAFPEGKRIDLDGAYLDFPDGFISVRQSQNELQLFRTRVEAKTKGDLDVRLNKVRQIITED